MVAISGFELLVDGWRADREFGSFAAEWRRRTTEQFGRKFGSAEPGRGWTKRPVAEYFRSGVCDQLKP